MYLKLAHYIRQNWLFAKSLSPFQFFPLFLDTCAGSLTPMGQYILYIICVHFWEVLLHCLIWVSSSVINHKYASTKLPHLLPDFSNSFIPLEWLRHSVFKLRIPHLLPDFSKSFIPLEWLRHSVFKLRIIMIHLLQSPCYVLMSREKCHNLDCL